MEIVAEMVLDSDSLLCLVVIFHRLGVSQAMSLLSDILLSAP